MDPIKVGVVLRLEKEILHEHSSENREILFYFLCVACKQLFSCDCEYNLPEKYMKYNYETYAALAIRSS